MTRRRVLVIEDDPDIGRLLVLQLHFAARPANDLTVDAKSLAECWWYVRFLIHDECS